MPERQPSMRSLAKQIGVSPAVISMVVNDCWRENKISEKTYQLVMTKLEEIDYRPNKLAGFLRQKRTETIGVILPLVHTFYQGILDGLEQATDDSFMLSLGISNYSPEKERRLLVSFIERRVDGIVLVPTGDHAVCDLIEEINRKRIPLVLADRWFEDVRTHAVGADPFEVGAAAAEHLIAQGYHSFVSVAISPSGPIVRPFQQQRVRGFESVVTRHLGDELAERYRTFEQGSQEKASLEELAERVVEAVLQQLKQPTAIFAMHPLIGEAILDVCLRRGIDMPGRLGLLTIDASEDAQRHSVMPLTTIRQDTRLIGRLAGRLLHDLIDGSRPGDSYGIKETAVHVIPRRSTALRG